MPPSLDKTVKKYYSYPLTLTEKTLLTYTLGDEGLLNADLPPRYVNITNPREQEAFLYACSKVAKYPGLYDGTGAVFGMDPNHVEDTSMFSQIKSNPIFPRHYKISDNPDFFAERWIEKMESRDDHDGAVIVLGDGKVVSGSYLLGTKISELEPYLRYEYNISPDEKLNQKIICEVLGCSEGYVGARTSSFFANSKRFPYAIHFMRKGNPSVSDGPPISFLLQDGKVLGYF